MRPVTQGVVASLASSIGFGFLDASTKVLVESMTPAALLILRTGCIVLLVLASLAGLRGLRVLGTGAVVLTAVRSALFALTGVLVVIALARLPLADTIALYFLSPVWTVFIAAMLLRERVTPLALTAALIGLAGMVLIMQPRQDGFSPAYLLPLLAGVSGAAQDVMARQLRGRTHPTALLLYGMLAILVVAPLAMPLEGFRPPGAPQRLLFAGCIAAAVIAYLFAAVSFQKAPARVIAPLRYLNLVWAVLLGYFIWGSVPEPATFAGSGCIAVAGWICVHMMLREAPAAARA